MGSLEVTAWVILFIGLVVVFLLGNIYDQVKDIRFQLDRFRQQYLERNPIDDD